MGLHLLRSPAGFKLRGLRARLLAIVLIATVPLTLALLTYAGVQNSAEQDRARASVQTILLNDVRSCQDLVSQGRATLETFGITFAIQAQRWDLVQGNAERLRALHPEYAGIAVADASGLVRASSPVAGRTVDISGEEPFRQAVASQRLVVSGYRTDPLTGRPTIAVTLPVYDAKSKLIAVEYIVFEPAQFATRLSTAGASSAALLVDGRGVLIGRNPALPGSVGKSVADAGLVAQVLRSRQGTAVLSGLDGVTREYSFAPVFPGGEGSLFAIVGFSPDALLASEQRAFVLTLAGFAGFALVALVVAWLVGTYSIYRPTLLLQSAAVRLSEGDLSARAVFGPRHDELGVLRDRFNEMAESLQTHVDELQRTRGELHDLNVDLEERVKRRTADLEAANKELETFSYSVSHDLRSPLRAIDGFSLALLEDHSSDLDEQGRKDLARVRANANRMGELIDGLLRLSRLSRKELHVADVDLSAIADDVAESMREIDPDRAVTFEIGSGVRGAGDPELLRIVLDNLIGNAWKFTSRHDTAHIEFGSTTLDGERAYFVRDDGAGFDMAYVHKLFGAFQRVHGESEFPGTGIGLATAARIVRRHGGRIWAEGEPDNGATFWFTLSPPSPGAELT
jgi:signal transduction histidine kinase